MNIRIYQATKGNYCFYVTNTSTDRFRVSSNITSPKEAEKTRVKLEKMLPLTKCQVQAFLTGGDIKDADKHYFDDFIQKFMLKTGMESQWEYATVQHFRCLRNRIRKHWDRLEVEQMDEDWLYTYIKWRTATALNTTLSKEVKSIKQVMRFIQKQGFDCSSILNASPKFKKASRPNVVFLTRAELKKLQEAELSTPYLERTRDMFLFCCYTGMRYSDMQKVDSSCISGGNLRFVTKKTNDTLSIPVNSLIEGILAKYGGKMPQMENQVYNRFIKTLCKEAGIDSPTTEIHYRGAARIEETQPKWKLISSHSARKTFVSNALMSNIPVTTVMSFTGHHSYQSMQSYIAVADEAKVEAMKILEGVFA